MNDQNIHNLPQQGPMTLLDLSNYESRRTKGLIEWEVVEGKPVMVLKQFDSAQNETAPLKHEFTSIQIKSIRNEREQRVLQIQQQILVLEQQIANIESENVSFYAALESDVLAVEEAENKK